MDKKIFIRVLNAGAAFSFLPIGTLVFLFSRRARFGYLISRNKLIKPINLAELKPFLMALEAAEDHRYRYHFGIDPIAIIRAMKNTLLGGRLEGASTIEQQFVRTCTGNRTISLTRKLEEVAISVLLSLSSNKDVIAYSYISCAYLGEGLCGYKSAISALWPGQSETFTNLHRAAVVIAMLKRPRPIGDQEEWKIKIHNRVHYIVSRQ